MATNITLSSSRPSRSKLYERYDVDLPSPSSNSSRKKWRVGGWFVNNQEQQQQRLQLPPDQWTNVEMIRYIFKNSSFKSKLIAILAIMILSTIIKSTISFYTNTNTSVDNDMEPKRGPVMTKYGLRPEKMDPDSHKRSNPFAPPGHQSYMEGVLERKRVKKRENPPSPLRGQNQHQQEELLERQNTPPKTQQKKSPQQKRSPQQARINATKKGVKGRKMPS